MKPSAPNAVSDIGIVGLATMGRNLALNFLDHGQCVSAWNLEPELTTGLENAYQGQGLYCAPTIEELIATLKRPRRVLLMIRAGAAVDQMLDQLAELLSPGDIVIDGGNSQFEATRERSQRLGKVGLEFVGLGVSGGASGARHGPSLMAGSSEAAWQALQPALTSIAARSPWGPCADRMGPDGAGHFVKMIHNGIEYGMMQAYAEGFDILKGQGGDAINPALRFDFDLPEIAEVWRRGSVVTSWLLDLTAAALVTSPKLEEYEGSVSDSGEGRWTVEAAIESATPADVLTAALYTRFRSRQTHTFAEKVLSAMRKGFGGHVEPK